MRPLELARLESLLRGFRKLRLLVVGDLVLDEYVWGDVERVSPEAPVPVVHVREETVVLGGAANVARNVVALGGAASFCSVVGDDAAGRRAAELIKDLGVDPGGLLVAPGRRPRARPAWSRARSRSCASIARRSSRRRPPSGARCWAPSSGSSRACDGAVLEDYGKGVLSKPVIARRDAALPRRGRAGGGRPEGERRRLSRAPRCSSRTCARPRRSRGSRSARRADLARAVARLRRRIGGGAVVVTRGADGMTHLRGRRRRASTSPPLAREVFDVQGAGDTSIAALALALRAGGDACSRPR